MPGFAVMTGTVGNQPINPFGLPDTTARHTTGTLLSGVSNYWGGGEFIYVKATAAIRQFGLCTVGIAFTSGSLVTTATEVGNTANLGRMLAVAMVSATTGQYFWACIGGFTIVNSNASVTADTTFGIAATGQGGANAAGKQVLNARVVTAATATVAKTGCVANSGSLQLSIPESSGWFAGLYLSGTGIAASTVVTDIDPSGTLVTLSVATTAAVSGTVTGTYNNGTVYYNIVHINRPFAQGAIT